MSNTEAVPTVRVYADYVCPFCHLGYASLDEYRGDREEPLEVEWHPFDLRGYKRGPDGEIDPDVDTGKDEEYFEEAKQGVRRLQEQYDVEMDLDVATDIDSLPAQIVSYALKGSEDYETWLAFDEAVLDALWRGGRDIGDADVLADIAESIGVDPDRIHELLADEGHHEAVREQFRRARQQGVTGVPTFAYDGHAARGRHPSVGPRAVHGRPAGGTFRRRGRRRRTGTSRRCRQPPAGGRVTAVPSGCVLHTHDRALLLPVEQVRVTHE